MLEKSKFLYISDSFFYIIKFIVGLSYMGNLKKVLIIDDDLSIRFVLKKILSQQLSNIDIFTSEDGVQGIGYAFILKPDLIVIDATLPKYSGRELVDFLSTNTGFKDTPIILLHEDDTFVENLPGNFIQISKTDELFPENLVNDVINEIGNIDDVPEVKRSFGIVNFLSRKIIGYSNSSFVNAKNAGKRSVFRKVFGSLGFLFNQILSGFYLSLFYLIVGRKEKEVNLEQKEKDSKAYRSVIYPKVGFSVAVSLFVGIHLFITLGGILTFGFLGTKIVNAASYTWDGGGVTNNWSDCDNWSTNICPTSLDTITFNGTSTKDAVVDVGFAGVTGDMTMSAGYTGTITLQRDLTVGRLTQSSGTFNASNQPFTVNIDLTLSAGSIFTASSGTTTLRRAVNITGGTFNHNGGTIAMVHVSGNTYAMACNNVTFNLVTISTNGVFTINSDCNVPLGNNPTITADGTININGTLSGTGTISRTSTYASLVFNAGGALSGFSGFNSALTVAGATLDLGAYTSFTTPNNAANVIVSSGSLTLPDNADLTGALIISGGTFNAPSGTMYVGRAFTVTNSPTFNANGGTIVFDSTGDATLSCNNVTFFRVTLAHTANTRTINSNCTLPLGNNPTTAPGGAFNLSGVLTGTGTLTFQGSITFATGANLSGFSGLVSTSSSNILVSGANLDLSAYTTFVGGNSYTLNSGSLAVPNGADFNGQLVIAGGTFNAPSGTMTLASNLTISGTPVFNHNGGTITLDGSTAVLSCNNVTFNLITVSSAATKTVGSNCNLPLGNNPNLATTSVVLNGTLSGTGTITAGAMTLTLNAGAAFSGFSGYSSTGAIAVSGGTMDFSAFTTFSLNSIMSITSGSISLPPTAVLNGSLSMTNGTLTFNTGIDLNGAVTISGGTVNAPSGVMTAATTFTLSGSAIFNHNSGTVTFDGTTTATIACNNVTFNLVTFAHTLGTKTVSSNCTMPLGNNPTLGITAGTVSLFGQLTGTGTLTTSRDLYIQNGANISGFNGLAVGLSLVLAATTASTHLDLSSYTLFDVNSAIILNTPTNPHTNTLTAPSVQMTVGADFTISSGAVFNHNNGVIKFDNTSGAVTCSGNVINMAIIQLAVTSGTVTVGSTCNIPLGNNPTITGRVAINGTITGTGTITSGQNITVGSTGVLSGFSGLNMLSAFVSTLTLNGANLDFSGYSVANFNPVVINSGTLTVPNNADFNSSLTITGGTFNAPSGNMNLAGNLTISGAAVFNHNNGTIIFDGAGATLSCNNVSFNNVLFDMPASGNPIKVIQSNCSFNLGHNPEYKGGMNLFGTLTGTGTLNKSTTYGSFSISTGAVLSGFTGIISHTAVTNAGATLDFSSYTTFDIYDDLRLNSGTFTAPPVLRVGEIWHSNGGTFNHNNGTVILFGDITNQSIVGSTTFYNLTKTTSVAETLSFEASSTQTILGTLTLKGVAGTNLELISSTPTSQYNVNAANIEVEYLDVQDFNNTSGNVIQAGGKNVTDNGNNTGWNFNNPSITNMSIESSISNSTTDTTPTILFNITDPNVSDTVKYQIQIDNNSDFTSPEVEYTSPLEAQGDKTFTVPSALPDSKYYLRIKGIDSSDGDGGYVNFNSGNGFNVDTTGPTGSLFLGYVTDSTNPEVFIISSITDLSGVSEMIYSEKSDFSDASYIPYAQYDTYTLSEGYGNKIVYIKYKDILGNMSATFSASISYTQTPQDVDIVVDSDAEEDEGTVGEALNAVAFRILDSEGNPISNIAIKLAEAMIEGTTDDNGIVVFEDVLLGKQKLLGVYNGVEFEHEVDITDSDKVITIVLDNGNNVSPLVVVGLVFGGVVVGAMVTYLLRRKTQFPGS